MSDDLKSVIEAAWEARADINTGTQGAVREAVEETLSRLDAGTLRVATRGDDGVWTYDGFTVYTYRENGVETIVDAE